jgi:MHS family proline/betaine transporter-like MFS transporter
MGDSTTTAAVPTTHGHVTRQSPLRTALAGLIGNVLEWFDFAVYGYFASDIGRQFFPQSDPAAQQMSAFGVFALGFLARPLGSLVLGMVGDRIGRRALLTLSIALMGGGDARHRAAAELRATGRLGSPAARGLPVRAGIRARR